MGNRTALIVVDVQDGIADATDGVPDAEQIKQAIGHILNLARQHNQNIKHDQGKHLGIAILFVQHDDQEPADPLHRGKPTWKLVFEPQKGVVTERLVSKDTVRISKSMIVRYFAKFPRGDVFMSNPDLAHLLREDGIANLVFVGLQTDYCVRASILGAIAAGFNPSYIKLLQGAHSTYDNTTTGRSYTQVKEDVEVQLANLGVCLEDWREFAF